MHSSSAYALEARHADVVATAVKSLTGQVMRKLSTEGVRDKSLFLRTPFYSVNVNTEIPGVPGDFVYANAKLIFEKVSKEVAGFGFFKVRHKFTKENIVDVKLFYKGDLIFN